MEEKYSVLMSVYYKEKPKYLEESILSMLHQTIPPSDFVIVCDGMLTPKLEEVLDDAQSTNPQLFQIIRLKERRGLGRALNVGLRRCRYELVARMDSDDISRKRRCEMQLPVFENPEIAIVGGTVWEFEGSRNHLKARRVMPERPEEIQSFARRRNPFNHPAVMYRKSAVQRAGGYRSCTYFEDYDLWTRMLSRGEKGYNVQEPVLYMRAGEELYQRRGGMDYARRAIVFRYSLYRRGFSRWNDFLISAGGQFAVCLLPNGFRKEIYAKLLRKE
ncbi:MAG: glycosyltransferase [Eubacteriales bacterium]|nr:glycosyltransferase [Eubacteriales bacterium]